MTKIYEITGELKGIITKDENRQYCNHKKLLLVDEHKRTLECDECGKVIDPFDYLLGVARDTRNSLDRRNIYRQEANEAYERLEEIKRKERNAKSRLKRAEDKLKEIK